jgi:hypothetical protein
VRKGFGDIENLVIKPIYYPFYVLDSRFNGEVYGTGERLARTRWNGRTEYKDYETFELKGPFTAYLDDQEKVALEEIVNEVIVNSVRPFDWRYPRLKQFNYFYLNGYNAEHRDIDFNTIAGGIVSATQDVAHSELSARFPVVTSSRFSSYESMVGYVLAPVWLLTYVDKDEERVYFFAVNGQNGHSSGVLPVDWKKSSIFIAGCAALMAAGGFIFEFARLTGLAG